MIEDPRWLICGLVVTAVRRFPWWVWLTEIVVACNRIGAQIENI
jgi:hypothetical protein